MFSKKKEYMDLDSGELYFSVSNDMLINTDGDFMMKTSEETAMDIDTGEIHFITALGSDDRS